MAHWNIPWFPRYYEINDPFAEIRRMAGGSFGPVFGPEVDKEVERVRLATPWEMNKAVVAGNAYSAEVRGGMVTVIANVLGHGYQVVVPEWDEEFLVVGLADGRITVGIATDLLLVPFEALTAYTETRKRPENRWRKNN